MSKFTSETIRKNHALWKALCDEYSKRGVKFYELGYNRIGVPAKDSVREMLVKDPEYNGIVRLHKGKKVVGVPQQEWGLIMTTKIEDRGGSVKVVNYNTGEVCRYADAVGVIGDWL